METKKQKGTSSEGRSKGNQSYYYVQGQRINVSKRDDLVAVSFHSRAPVEDIEAFRAARSADIEPSDEFKEMQQGNLRIYHIAAGRAADVRALAEDLRAQANVEKVGDVYVNEDGQPLVLTDEIVCKFKPEMTSDQIDALKGTYGLETVEALGFSENAFVLRVKPEAGRNALEIADELVEQGRAIYAYPNWIEYIGYRQVRPTDPMFGQQWHHENTGQVAGNVAGTPGADIRTTLAWQTTMGNPNVRIAVIDGGTDIAHNDLNAPGKIVDPIDFTVNPPDNNPVGSSHGTQVAGMAVAAANNGCAGAGSAPNCRLIAIRVDDQMGLQLRMARAFVYAADNGADIITCSLGPNGIPWTMTDALREAIDYATTYGRRGRGCVYTQAVDNTQDYAIANDQVSSYERSIAVSRTDNRDRYRAAVGPELDICAPGQHVLTITNTTPGNACPTRIDTGTSFATPLTAGVACLILSVNPNLSWEEVRQVLLDSADKIDAAANPYNPAPAGRPPGTRNDRYGYGRVNAQRAVHLAQAGSPRDLYIRDRVADTGAVPQPRWGFWDSPDIWVRNNDDNGTTHQNTVRGQDNFVYARIWNRGTRASLPCWVRFYITTFAGTEFRYTYDFKPDTSSAPGGGTAGNLRPRSQFPTPATYLIGVQRIESIPGRGNVIAKVRWERTLIPPATNWHPCLLVEVSPHDGPAPAGMHIWENNNLGQKNITIVDARRGQLRGQSLDLPFRFSHPLLSDPFVSLEIRKVRMPRDWQVFLDVKEPKLLEAIAGAAGVSIPVVPVTPVAPIAPISPILPIRPPLPWRLTFLEEAKIAISSGEARAEEEVLVFTFPRGSSVEVGRGRIADIIAEEGLEPLEVPEEGEEIEEEGRAWRSVRPAFSIAALEGANVLALNPALSLAKVKVPLAQAGWKESSLKIRIPDNAIPGESYVLDVAERNSKGQLVGGIRLQVNVVA